jgi:hypothetical protein
MLATALPGVREVRTPLTIGYGYLLALWLYAYDELPHSLEELEALTPALAWLISTSTTAAILAISFAAYILGGFAVTLTARALKISGPPDRNELGQLPTTSHWAGILLHELIRDQ